MLQWEASLLKMECYEGKQFDTFEQLKKTIHEYIHYYNYERIQCELKELGPVNYRTQSLICSPNFLGTAHNRAFFFRIILIFSFVQ